MSSQAWKLYLMHRRLVAHLNGCFATKTAFTFLPRSCFAFLPRSTSRLASFIAQAAAGRPADPGVEQLTAMHLAVAQGDERMLELLTSAGPGPLRIRRVLVPMPLLPTNHAPAMLCALWLYPEQGALLFSSLTTSSV